MDDSESPISKAVADVKAIGDEGKAGLGRVLEDGPPPLDSAVKPFVEQFTHAAESLVQKVADSSSPYVTEVGEKFGLLSSPLDATKSSDKATEETLPTSDKIAGDSSEAAKSKPRSAETEEACVDATPRATHTQVCDEFQWLAH